MPDFTGKITTFEVLDDERKARIHSTGSWAGWAPAHPNPFRLSDDSDSQFLAMCDICTKAIIAGTPVTVSVDAGSPDEVDRLRIGPAIP
jgi:hypothetical protein